MATLNELADRLLSRFKDVPNVTLEDATNWVELSMNEHGFVATDDVPTSAVSLILLYAEADGASQIALRTAHYFSFVDKDESIDKSSISTRYRTIASELWERYRRKKEEGKAGFGGSRFTVMRRLDR